MSWGRDLGNWEPHVGATLILSMGPAGDDPLVRRYQEAVFGDFGQATVPRTLWDLFVGLRFRLR